MKRIILIFTSFILILFLAFYFNSDYKHKEFKYNDNCNQLDQKKNSFFIEGFLMNYYYRHGEFPIDYRKIDTSFYNLIYNENIKYEDFNYIRDQFYLDPFSKDSAFFFYKPIYNKYNNKREACLLLSAGIDGKINTILPDTIYLNDSLNINTYNDYNQKYNYCFSWFGKKDILVLKLDGITNMKTFNKNFSLNTIVNYFKDSKNKHIKYNQMLNKAICTEGVVDSVISKYNDKYIVLKDSNIHLLFNLYYPDSISTNIGKSIKLLGICNKYLDDSIIEFINTIECNNIGNNK